MTRVKNINNENIYSRSKRELLILIKKNKLVAFFVSKLECCVSGRKKDMG
jgi:hypothetical protein